MKEYDSYKNIPEDEKVEFLYVKFSDNRVFKIPADLIAGDMAEYYSDKHNDTSYEEEYERAFQDPYQLLDWVRGNMSWEDVEEEAELVRHEKSEPSEEFTNADFSFVTG